MVWLENQKNISPFIKKYKYIILVLLLGLFLMTLPEKQDATKVESAQKKDDKVNLQESLEQILEKIDGAGKVSVLLTELSGEEMVYQMDENTSDASDTFNKKAETVIINNADRDENGLIRRVISPVYQGAIIVCQGGNSAIVRLSIIEAVSKVTGLSSNQISVLKMK